jgi:hypothetical protein
MSSIDQQQLFLTVAVSHSHDGDAKTIIYPEIIRTRVEAVKALWKMIVDNKLYFPNVIYMWKELFDDKLENKDVYDEMSEHYNHEDFVLIRKLITPKMNARIQKINERGNQLNEQGLYPKRIRSNENYAKNLTRYDKNYEQMNIEFDLHLRSVQMTEDEIINFMENFSECSEEFGAGSQILTSWNIQEVKIAQQTLK